VRIPVFHTVKLETHDATRLGRRRGAETGKTCATSCFTEAFRSNFPFKERSGKTAVAETVRRRGNEMLSTAGRVTCRGQRVNELRRRALPPSPCPLARRARAHNRNNETYDAVRFAFTSAVFSFSASRGPVFRRRLGVFIVRASRAPTVRRNRAHDDRCPRGTGSRYVSARTVVVSDRCVVGTRFRLRSLVRHRRRRSVRENRTTWKKTERNAIVRAMKRPDDCWNRDRRNSYGKCFKRVLRRVGGIMASRRHHNLKACDRRRRLPPRRSPVDWTMYALYLDWHCETEVWAEGNRSHVQLRNGFTFSIATLTPLRPKRQISLSRCAMHRLRTYSNKTDVRVPSTFYSDCFRMLSSFLRSVILTGGCLFGK